MPNGKPGDHPITDIVVHGSTVFGPEVDEKVRLLATRSSQECRHLLEALVMFWPVHASSESDLRGLSYILDKLIVVAGLNPQSGTPR